jgi:hypothetical protein
MSIGAGALDVPIMMTSAESLLITIKITDGATPSDYTWSYALRGCQSLDLTEADGITVNDVASTVTIDPGADYRLSPGDYEHGCVIVDKVTGQSLQLFDGSGTVTRSPNA